MQLLNIFFVLLPALLSCGSNLLTAITENDPSTLVDGVSVITGDLYSCEEDLIVQGQEPIHVRRAYLSADGLDRSQKHLLCRRDAAGFFHIEEVNGTLLTYHHNKIPKHGPIRCDRLAPQKEKGISNTSSGKISGQTNLKNQHLLVAEDWKSFTLFAADGTRRHYRNLPNQKQESLLYYYVLDTEELPNGNKLHYTWQGHCLVEIRSSNPSGSKSYARLRLPKLDPKNPPREVLCSASDGKVLKHGYSATKYLSSVSSPDLPEQTRSYTRHPHSRIDLLSAISFTKERTLTVEYDDTPAHRVKTLYGPVGDRQIPIRRFFYSKNSSYVLDADGQKTTYFWNDSYHLTQIDRYDHSEKFVWDDTRLSSRSFIAPDGTELFSRSLRYDDRGNVTEETFSGNLSGRGSGEKVVKRSSYSSDGKNLPLRVEETNGLISLYQYQSGTNLPLSKHLCDGTAVKIRYSYEYNSDLILVREIVDDGLTRKIRQITPIETGNYVGLPEKIEERYWDGSQERLLRASVLHYTKGALVAQQDIYDAAGILCYSLYKEYDDKGRILRETNPLGQEALSRYDEVGNRIYLKDFAGLETHCHYNLSNHLIRKEERGADGLSREVHYVYDVRHVLLSEIDEHGYETKCVYDPMCRKIETHQPLGAILRQEYDSAGNAVVQIDGEGHVTKTTYNAYSKPIQIIHPDGAQERLCYSLDGALLEQTDAIGVTTRYQVDFLGRVISKRIGASEERWEYTGQQLTAKIDADGQKISYEYDGAARKIAEVCAGERTEYGFDALGRVSTIQKGELRTLFKFDLLDRILEKREESAFGELLRLTQYEYSEAGLCTAVVRSVAGAPTREEMRYDSFKRLIWRCNEVGAVETSSYQKVAASDLGKTVLQKICTDATGLQTIETFDGEGRIVSVETRKQKSLLREERHYNLTGQLRETIHTIADRAIRTEWHYDCCNRPITLIEGNGAKITRTLYTARGEKAQTIKPDGTVLYYTYNDQGGLTQLSSSDGTVSHVMEYSLGGRLIRSDGLQRQLDGQGRTLSEAFPQGYCIERKYDLQGRCNQLQIPVADCLVDYDYGAADLQSVTRRTIRGDPLYTHRYISYDLSGNLLEQELIGGLGPVSFSFNTASRLDRIEASLFSAEVLSRDLTGQIRSQRIQGEKIDYEYDELHQLIAETGRFAHRYLHDALNTRLQKDRECYAVNALNEDLSHFEYNANGLPIRSGKTRYFYDALDRLIRIEAPAFEQRFTYDFDHRCLSKETYSKGVRKTLYFLYDGRNEIGALDENLRLVELRVLGATPRAEIGAAIAIELGGVVYAPIHDIQGSVALLLPLDGKRPSSCRYSAFGEEFCSGAVLSPWRFCSKRTDLQSGLVYYGRRFYIPVLGHWLTPDPKGFTDGLNLYAFVRNDPLTRVDLYGLSAVPTWNQPLIAWGTPQLMPSMLQRPLEFTPLPEICPAFGMGSNRPLSFYVNGIQNERPDALGGAEGLFNTLRGRATVVPAYDPTLGKALDLMSVNAMIAARRDGRQYTSDFITLFRKTLRDTVRLLEANNDPRKIFITAFSRGAGSVYHTVHPMSLEEKNRLIIVACGPIMMLPRRLGFQVANLVSKGDPYSGYLNSEILNNPGKYDTEFDVQKLDQKDGFSGFQRDHFFLSKTYQEEIWNTLKNPLEEFGTIQ